MVMGTRIATDGLRMIQHPLAGEERSNRIRWGWLRCALVLLLSGCQVLPARIATCENCETGTPRTLIVARQVVCDTALETARHPVRSVANAVVEPSMALAQAAGGLLHKRLGLHLTRRPGPLPLCRVPVDPDLLEMRLRKVAGDEVQPALIHLHLDGKDALAALHHAIDQATCRIDIVMYIWDNDPLGWEIARLLAAKAGPHLTVRILIDGGGNLLQGSPEEASAGAANAVVCWLARQPHVQVIRVRNPFLRFDHRKIVLVDGRLVWSGGRNFSQSAFVQAHDLSYTLQGALATELTNRYERFWQAQGGPPGDPAPPPLADFHPNAHARLVRTTPLETSLARTVYTAVDSARSHIYIENPYFTDNKLFAKLVQARRRGVDVRVVLSLNTGTTLHDHANRALANRLLRAGIRVYLYPGLLHVKAMSIDGCWAYLGTGNFDSLSLRHNREVGIAVSHGPLVAELEQRLFQADFQPEWELTGPLPLTLRDRVAETIASVF